MKIVLILALFDFGSSAMVTAEFDDVAACENTAARMFQGVDQAPEVRPLVPAEGMDVIEGTMIAYGHEGDEIGAYSCNPIGME